jgi:hypothetical protein
VARGDGVRRIEDLRERRAARGAEHQHGARVLAGPDEDVAGAVRAMEVVPLAQRLLPPVDHRKALPGEDEETFLSVLGVVQTAGLAGVQDLDGDPEVREAGVG